MVVQMESRCMVPSGTGREGGVGGGGGGSEFGTFEPWNILE